MGDFDFNNIDKTKWKKYRFEQIAKSIGERVEPQQTELEVYVGLEHLDSDSVHIKRTGVPSDVEGTKLRVYPGDVIFGKRRAYQRKAAIATFDGICSAHAMVLRAIESVIDPKLFPFFLHSDYFMDRAIDISVGSLSPTINWGTLKTQEFLLPPKEQQAKLAELLWAADEVTSQHEKLKDILTKCRDTTIEIVHQNSGECTTLGENGVISYGMGVPPKYNDKGVAVIRATNINGGEIIEKDMLKAMPEDVSPGKRVFLNEGDIIVVRSGAYTGDIGYISKNWANTLAGYDLVFKPDHSKVNSIFIRDILLSKKIQSYFKSESTRSAQPHLNAEQLRATLIPALDLKSQNAISKKIEKLTLAFKGASLQKARSKQIQKQLINQIFSA